MNEMRCHYMSASKKNGWDQKLNLNFKPLTNQSKRYVTLHTVCLIFHCLQPLQSLLLCKKGKTVFPTHSEQR